MSQISVTYISFSHKMIENFVNTDSFCQSMLPRLFVMLCHSAQLSHWCQAQPGMKPLSILVLLSNHSSSRCSDAKVEMISPVCSEGSGCIYFMKSVLTRSWFRFPWRKCRFQAEGFWKQILVLCCCSCGEMCMVLDCGSRPLPALQACLIISIPLWIALYCSIRLNIK